jgi:3'-phosphoadenosine 5'-phosphosulfate sulfotransferase (PAPS reductase)/FAD synthetase
MKQLIQEASNVITQAIADYNPIKVYALVSGGNDSTVTAHLAATFGPRLDALVHINTGIGVEQTREYTRDFARWLNLPLIERHGPRTYEDLVLQYGFPGPAAHRYMYIWLKERALQQVRREAQNGQRRRVVFITGVRLDESRRRMGHVEQIKRQGNTVWVAPIRDFTHQDIWDYREEHEIPRNEVTEILHMSGECLCGAFAKPKELDWLAMWYPDVANRIKRLEQQAHQAGLKSCHWGPQSSKAIREAPGPLCHSCQGEFSFGESSTEKLGA